MNILNWSRGGSSLDYDFEFCCLFPDQLSILIILKNIKYDYWWMIEIELKQRILQV